MLAVNLRKAGYACDCVYDGMAAADALEGKPYDLILLDVMLPRVDGYELMSYIAPLEIPVIFLTAKASVTDRVKGLRLGADDYLTKPFEIIELLARVEGRLCSAAHSPQRQLYCSYAYHSGLLHQRYRCYL